MNRNTTIAVSALLLVLSSAALACDYPMRADIPVGSSATKEEMIAGQKSVKKYMAAMEEYLTCIDAAENDAVAQLDEPSEDVLMQRQDMLAKKHNAAVEEMELVAAEFNNEVRSYKAQAE